jgi:hypothetical protein
MLSEIEETEYYSFAHLLREGLELLTKYDNIIIIDNGDRESLAYYFENYKETIKAIKNKENSMELVTYYSRKPSEEINFWLYVEGPNSTLKPYMRNFISGRKYVYICKNENNLKINRNFIKVIDPISAKEAEELKTVDIVVIQLTHKLVNKSSATSEYTSTVPFKQIYLLD